MATTKTLSDLRTQAYSIIKQPEDVSAYPYTLVDTFLNKAQNDICFGNVTDLQTGEKVQKLNLPFLNARTFFTSVAPNSLSVDAVVSGATLTLSDASSFASSGVVWIDGNIVTYSGKAANVLTGCSGISFAFKAGVKVFQAYSLPADFGQMTQAFYDTGTGGFQFKMIGFDYRDFKEPTLNSLLFRFFRDDFTLFFREFYYTLIDSTYFLPFIPQSSNAIRFEYQKKPTQLTVASTVATIPDEYSLVTIPYLAIAETMYNRGESEEGIRLNHFGFINVQNMYRFYETQQHELIYGQRMRTVHDGILNI